MPAGSHLQSGRSTMGLVGRTVAYRLRADVRHRWRSLAGLALLIAILGGLVLALAAGARRTSSAYERLAESINPPELLVSPFGDGDTTAFYEDVGRLDGVRAVGPVAGINAVPEVGTPTERLADALEIGLGRGRGRRRHRRLRDEPLPPRRGTDAACRSAR